MKYFYTHEDLGIFVWLVYRVLDCEYMTKCSVEFLSSEENFDGVDRVKLSVSSEGLEPLCLSSLIDHEFKNLKENVIYKFDETLSFPNSMYPISIMITKKCADNDFEIVTRDATYEDLWRHISPSFLSDDLWEI